MPCVFTLIKRRTNRTPDHRPTSAAITPSDSDSMIVWFKTGVNNLCKAIGQF